TGDVASEQMTRPRRGVANDDRVRSHRLEVSSRVGERLALARARARGADVDRVRREPLGGDLERGAGTRARLVEEVDDRLPAERRHLLDVALRDLLERPGGVEDGADLLRRDPLQPEQMTLRERHGPSSALAHRLDENLILPVRLREPDLDLLAPRGREILADVVGPDRQLAVAAVDQDGELDRLWPAEVDQRVHRGAHRPAGE